MTKVKIRGLLFLILFIPAGITFCRNEVISFDGEVIREIVALLASDEFEGRQSGSAGSKRAAAYLKGELRKAGLQPGTPDSSFTQNFSVDFFQIREVNLKIDNRLEEESFLLNRNFRVPRQNVLGSSQSSAIFAGYGMRTADYDDFAGLETRGRALLLCWPLPTFLEGKINAGERFSLLSDLEAAALLVYAPEEQSFIAEIPRDLTCPLILVDRKTADFLLFAKGFDMESALAQIAETRSPMPLELNAKVYLEIDCEHDRQRSTENILTVIPGRHPELSREIIMVGAHYDHLGRLPDQGIFAGANDNASGTAVLLEVMKKMAGVDLKRTIMAAFWSAEESGLQGSRNFFQHPVVDPGAIKAYLNLDMVGQGKDRVSILFNPAQQETWQNLAARLPAEIRELILTTDDYGQRSDHLVFAAHGIPSFLFGTPRPSYNYHTVLDRVELINPGQLEKTALVLFHCLVILAEAQ